MKKKEVSIFELNEFPIGNKLKIIGRLYSAKLSGHLKYLELEKHSSILLLLDYMKNGCNQNFLANKFHVDKTLMVSVISELKRKGLVKRIVNPLDRRGYLILLTGKAKRNIPEIKKKVKQINNKIMNGFTKVEKEQLSRLLISAYCNIR